MCSSGVRLPYQGTEIFYATNLYTIKRTTYVGVCFKVLFG